MTLRIVYMGSPDFSLPVLMALNSHYQIAGVVTQPDRPAGRGKHLTAPPVKKMALDLDLPVIQPRRLRDEGVWEQLIDWAPDMIVVAAFGQILRQNVLDMPRLGCINVHASLLPRWRGAAPIQASILHGDAISGVTIMKMDAGIDTGAILASRQIRLSSDETTLSLSERLAGLGAGLLIDTLPEYLSGKIDPQPQDENFATYAPQIKKEAGMLDFSNSAVEMERQIRAFTPWPGSFLELGEMRLKILTARVVTGGSHSVGNRTIVDSFPAVETKDGVLIFKQVHPAGKKPMSGMDFLRGYPRWKN